MVDASTLGAPAVPTVQAGEGTSGSGQLQTSTSESQCAWIFKEGGAETTRLMNLINLEMLKSSAVKKLTSTAKPVSMPAANHESLKKQIKNEFARSMGLMSIGGEQLVTENRVERRLIRIKMDKNLLRKDNKRNRSLETKWWGFVYLLTGV